MYTLTESKLVFLHGDDVVTNYLIAKGICNNCDKNLRMADPLLSMAAGFLGMSELYLDTNFSDIKDKVIPDMNMSIQQFVRELYYGFLTPRFGDSYLMNRLYFDIKKDLNTTKELHDECPELPNSKVYYVSDLFYLQDLFRFEDLFGSHNIFLLNINKDTYRLEPSRSFIEKNLALQMLDSSNIHNSTIIECDIPTAILKAKAILNNWMLINN